MEANARLRKTVSISSKRQITIPQQFYRQLGFGQEAECILRGDELVLRPLRPASGGEFDAEILKDLLAEGLTGEPLLAAFKERQAGVRPAVQAMLSEARAVAEERAPYAGFADVFEAEE